MDRLKGKVAIVTGAGAGMGRETSILFAKEGARVALFDINEEDGLNVIEEIRAIGGIAKFWKVDVSNEENVKQAINEVKQDCGKIDILINNAGITGVDKKTHELTNDEWDQVFNVDVKGVFYCSKYVIPHMLENKGGSIVNLSSIYGTLGSHELTPYHAAKGAVYAMTKQDAISYAKDNIRVNSIHPGTIMTPLVKELGSRMEGGLPAYEKLMGEKHPIGHAGEPIDVAYGCLYLASDESKFVTGEDLYIDGGYSAQ